MKAIFLAIALSLSLHAADLKTCAPGVHFPCLEPVTGDRLIGGTVPDMKDWPNSVWIGNCSATVVGERVLATAAHCVRNGATVTFSKGADRYKAKCARHPEYSGNSTADWVLCLIDQPVAGGEYEILNTNKVWVKAGTTLTNSGYGCQKWGNGLDGKFRIGDVPITAVPSGSNYDIVTRGKVALCSGDSGGASFLRMQFGHRVVMGVNSRSNTTTTSYMPSWAEDTVVEWGREWAASNGVLICGYHEQAKGCRLAVPPVPNKFAVENSVVAVQGQLKPGKEKLLEKAKTLVSEAIAKLQD